MVNIFPMQMGSGGSCNISVYHSSNKARVTKSRILGAEHVAKLKTSSYALKIVINKPIGKIAFRKC